MSAPLVVKLGSALVAQDGRANETLLREVAQQVAEARPACVVSSGAIALGAAKAGFASRPRGLPALQAASSLGQAELQRAWSDAFLQAGVHAAQVLLTGADIAERRSYVNVRNALDELFRLGAVPVLNENDATATDEISFGDNDVLAAQVAVLLRARRLILLTSVEGVLDEGEVVTDGAAVRVDSFGPATAVGRGGIASKVAAAQLAAAGGVPATIASPPALAELLAGGSGGTHFAEHATSESAYKLWLRYGKRAVARLEVDEGAVEALEERRSSLLAVGVVSWSDDFRAGDGVEIADGAGRVLARGIVSVDAAELAERRPSVEVVHRDRLVLVS
jgi:glutamate 5-kinase